MNHYAYLNGRVSVLSSRLFSAQHFEQLLEQPLEQVTILPQSEEYNFNELLTKTDTAVIEKAWLMHMLTDFQVLIRSLSGIERDILMYWFQKCDIANLKTIVRGKMAGLNTEAIKEQLLALEPLTTLPLEQLLTTEDISELLRQLEGSPFGHIAQQARRVFEKEHQLYSLDAVIDRQYLLGLVQRVRALRISQRRLLLPLMRIFIDRYNLLWLLRYRFVYQLSAAETYYLLIPTAYKLNRQRLQQLVEFNSFAEVLAQLPEPYASLLAESEDIFTVDQHMLTEVTRVAEYTLKYHVFTFARIFAYVLLRELEMRRVMAIIKGKRLGLKTELIAKATQHPATFMS